jgi:hypothetical protein
MCGYHGSVAPGKPKILACPKPAQPSNKMGGGRPVGTPPKDRVVDRRQVDSLEMHPRYMPVKKDNRRLHIVAKAALHVIGEDGIRQFVRRAATHNHHS